MILTAYAMTLQCIVFLGGDGGEGVSGVFCPPSGGFFYRTYLAYTRRSDGLTTKKNPQTFLLGSSSPRLPVSPSAPSSSLPTPRRRGDDVMFRHPRLPESQTSWTDTDNQPDEQKTEDFSMRRGCAAVVGGMGVRDGMLGLVA